MDGIGEFTRDGRQSTKAQRVDALRDDQFAKAPQSYRHNSHKEELCLKYTEQFTDQLLAIFPEKDSLVVKPENEFGIPKLICTTLRPTQLPYKDLYDAEACAKFVSDLISYEPLPNAIEPPTCIPSPSSTLQTQAGDSFDMSLLLCSYLLGAGYDAYCIMGYAPRRITLHDTCTRRCLLPEDEIRIREYRAKKIAANSGVANVGKARLHHQATGIGSGNSTVPVSPDEATLAASSPVTDGIPGENSGEQGGVAPSGSSAALGGEATGAESGALPVDATASDISGAAGTGGGGAAPAPDSIAVPVVGVVDAVVQQPGGALESKNNYVILEPQKLESKYQQEIADRAEGRKGGRKNGEGSSKRADNDQHNDDDNGELSDDSGKLDDENVDDMLQQEDAANAQSEEQKEVEEDALYGRRLHCWVLVRAGKRMVDDNFFLEPTTGQRYPVAHCPYYGISSLWNTANYWVNVGPDNQAPRMLSYNLKNTNQWEHVFFDPHLQEGVEVKEGDEGSDMDDDDNPEDKESEDDTENVLDLPPSWVSKLVLPRETYRRRYGTTGQKIELLRKAKRETYAPHLHPQGIIMRVFLFKDSQRTNLLSTHEYFANRRDKLVKRTRYPQQGRIVEDFSEGRASGLKKLTEVAGKHRVLEFYTAARLDGLERREEIIGEKVIEQFMERDDNMTWRSVTVMSPAHVTAASEAANDLLARGLGTDGASIVGTNNNANKNKTVSWPVGKGLDVYAGRSRGMVTGGSINEFKGAGSDGALGISGGTDGSGNGSGSGGAGDSKGDGGVSKSAAGQIVLGKGTLSLPGGQLGDLRIIKMTEKFMRDDGSSADDSVAKRTYFIESGTIRLLFHYAKGRVTRSSRRFFKDRSITPEVVLADKLAVSLRPEQVEQEMQECLQSEKDCYQAVRDSERESQDVLALRRREEQSIMLEKSVFDRASERAKEDVRQESRDNVQDEKDTRQVDYLTPFLPTAGASHAGGAAVLGREDAENARDSCLRALKERLLERANIIQRRLDDENSQLAKKQAAFQRSRDHVEGADDEFEKFCSEAMFRIQILEQRLARHEETALQKYADMDHKLRNDPRLSSLYS